MARYALASAVLILATVFILDLSVARAAAPRNDWRTIVSPSFRVHYHEGLGPLAEGLAAYAEGALETLVVFLGNVPELPIHVVLTDESDSPNGFANVLPQNVIVLLCAQPEPFGTLADHDDFMQLLFLHELVHVVHLDTIGGFPGAFNRLFGKTFAPNLVQPRWFIEGVAVYLESHLTSAGRVRSAFVDMLIREQVLGDRFPTIDEVSNYLRRFPGDIFPWILGGRFLDFISRRHDAHVLGDISKSYGARTIPYGINVVSRQYTEESYVELWDAWQAEETARARAVLEDVRARGIRAGRALARASELVSGPEWGPRGELALVEEPRDGDVERVFLAPDLSSEVMRLRISGGAGSYAPDGRTFVAEVLESHAEVFAYHDLERIDLATGERRQLTFGQRLQQPHVASDGDTIIAVAQGQGATRLVTLSLSAPERAPRGRFALSEGEQVWEPRWSPDGRWVVASVLVPGGARQIVLFERDGTRLGALTEGMAHHHSPDWSPDGRYVYFTADRGGVFNIYRVGLEERVLEKMTDVETGAFHPRVDPSGRTLAFVLGTPDGWEVRLMALAQTTPRPPDPVLARPVVSTSSATFAAYAHERYAPWESLLPRAYLPTTGVDGVGNTIGVMLAGGDVVGLHAYQLRLAYGLESERLGYALSYVNRSLFAPVSVSSSLVTSTRPGWYAPSAPVDDRLETIWRLRVGVSFPLGRWDFGHSVSLAHEIEVRSGLDLVSEDPLQPAPIGPGDVIYSAVAASWSISNVRYFPESISPSAGSSLDVTVRVNDPVLGSAVRLFELSGHWGAYWTLPWLKHHVLATRVALGGAAGDAHGRSIFVLGGLPVRDVLSDAVNGISYGADVIRGYEVAAVRGNAFYLGTLEYRLPLWIVGRGIETLPFFVDRFYAAAFADAGDAFSGTGVDLARVRVGVGGELRADLSVGYFVPITARVGYARGLSEDGVDNFFLVLGGLF